MSSIVQSACNNKSGLFWILDWGEWLAIVDFIEFYLDGLSKN